MFGRGREPICRNASRQRVALCVLVNERRRVLENERPIETNAGARGVRWHCATPRRCATRFRERISAVVGAGVRENWILSDGGERWVGVQPVQPLPQKKGASGRGARQAGKVLIAFVGAAPC